jgi:hypothetical protein
MRERAQVKAKHAMLSRRNLFVMLFGTTSFGRGGSIAASVADLDAKAGYRTLSALCASLRCSRAIAEACLRTLPEKQARPEYLASLILAEVSPRGAYSNSTIVLRTAARDQSQDDFRKGKIVNVDGWMLSLTEARIYGFAALLARHGENPSFGGGGPDPVGDRLE